MTFKPPSAKPPPTQSQLDRYAELFTNSAPLRAFGLKLSFPDGKCALIKLDPVLEHHRGGLGSDAINGGVLAAVFDLAIGCTPALYDPTRRSATVELSMHFMRAVRGNSLTAKGTIDRVSSVLCFSSASIFDEQGTECATCHGIARISEMPWASGESPAVS